MMIPTLKILTEQVRRATLDLLEGPPEEWLTWAPAGTSNHMLWHAGHSLWVQEILTLRPLIGGDRLPAGWTETFGEKCRPVAETTDWPAISDLARLLKEQLVLVHDTLEMKSSVLHDQAQRMVPEVGWPLLAGLIHGWHDEARHHGEMYLLFKMQLKTRSPLADAQ